MCEPFSVPFTGDASEVVERARAAITADRRNTFNGSETSGSFSIHVPLGHVDGTYAIHNQSIQVTITHKPGVIGCGTIEKELRQRLG